MSIQELREMFIKADPRFGPVPFWWWSAEEVTAERVRWQLQKFRSGGLRNIGIINIAPTGPQYGSVGDQPVYFSEQWWSMFEVALREAERLGMNLFFYDQIGFSGSNFPARMVAENPQYTGYMLRRSRSDEPLPEDATVLLETDPYTYYEVRQGFNWLDPEATALLLNRVHGEFERRFPQDLGKTIAGSFQDELPPLPLWTENMLGLYKEAYQEDLTPLLPALFDDLPNSGHVRRRVYKLAAELAETSFFKPISQWHEKYNMLLCCDQAGPARRADVHGAQRLYLDYFCTHRWYSAAGSDMDGEIKPHASMVHLHGGKRVFLEAFHTSGWGGTLEETMHWLIPWFQAGVTLYSPHSVYYSTRGGWWEWAPPDTGWRQPYYEHYSVFADTVSRVCSMLSQGVHVADIAVHYPSYAVCGHMSLDDAKNGEHPMDVSNRMPNEALNHLHEVYGKVAGKWNRRDYKAKGILQQAKLDFDIADDSALEKAVVENGKLRIAEESFSVLLLCGTTLMDDAAKRSMEHWIRQGGLVIGVEVPQAERNVEGIVYVDAAEEALPYIKQRIPERVDGKGSSLQRRTKDADIYLLLPDDGTLLRMHQPASNGTSIQENTMYRIRTQGVPQLWDPVSGDVHELTYRRDGEWVEVEVTYATWPAALVVCPYRQEAADRIKGIAWNKPDRVGLMPANVPSITSQVNGRTLPSDDWRVLAVPTLDNRYGDFDLHGNSAQFLPIERREVQVKLEEGAHGGIEAGWHLAEWDDASWTTRLWSEADYWTACKGERFDSHKAWPVVYSHTFGDLKFRTWAGRMGRVPRRFLNLGEAEPGETVWARTNVMASSAGRYWVRVESNVKMSGWMNKQEIEWTGGPEEQTAWVELQQGSNEFLLRAEAIVQGLIRAGVEVNEQARAALPKWIYSNDPNPNTQISATIPNNSSVPIERVRMVFAARGRVALYVNGKIVTEHGDFNPYIRQGQEEVDITPWWQPGENEVKFVLPEGAGEVLADGVVERFNGETTTFCTGDDWLDEQGNAPAILHEAVLQFAETETLWLTARPHPLPNVGWLMPESEPQRKPLPFHPRPQSIGHPVWIRFPLPVGAERMHVACRGKLRVWINGEEKAVRDGEAIFAPQKAGVKAAIRIEPEGPYTDADVLLAPIRFMTSRTQGALGDWRSALSLPHHSGVVEYETVFDLEKACRVTLDLGHVRGTAEVWLDGNPIGVRVWRPFRFDLGARLYEGSHRLRIRVTNTLGTHYEVGRPTSNVGGDANIAYWGGDIEPGWSDDFASGGLYGPVRIYEHEWTLEENDET